MGPTDEELDRDWQPSGRRPQSTIARSFSAELMDIFKIENSIADLDEQVNKRKQQVTSQTSELESLEARLKEMEERLKRSAATQGSVSAGNSPRANRQGLGDKFGQAAATSSSAVDKEAAAKTSRPGTAKPTQQAPAHGGAMPPTPTASEGEYELVGRHDHDHHHHQHHHHRDLPSSTTSATAGRSPGTVVTRNNFADYVFVSKDGGDRDI